MLTNFEKCVALCGSRHVENHDLTGIIDKFHFIIRHNFLLHNNKFGTKVSNKQIVNCHIYNNLHSKSHNEFVQLYNLEFGSDSTIASKVFQLFSDKPEIFSTYCKNNTDLLNDLLKTYNLKPIVNKECRVGLSYIPVALKLGLKPYLFGYSVEPSTLLHHQYNYKFTLDLDNHDPEYETVILTKLHCMGLLDMSFCFFDKFNKLEFSKFTVDAIQLLK